MSIKRLALCRSQGRLFVLLRFVGQDIAGLIEQEGPQAFAHATTNDVSVPALALSVDHGRILALCPSVADYERELVVLVLPFLDGSTKQSLRCARLSATRNAASAAVDTRLMPFVIYRQTPARCGVMRLPGRETPSAPLSSRSSIRT